MDMDGNILARYKSVAEASRQTGISKSPIGKTCRREQEQTGGYFWRYSDENKNMINNTIMRTILLFLLMGMLSFVHFKLQPQIESLFSTINPEIEVSQNFTAQLKPFRVRRKWMVTFCLFLVILSIILGLQVYETFDLTLNIFLVVLGALFAFRANRALLRFGWI